MLGVGPSPFRVGCHVKPCGLLLLLTACSRQDAKAREQTALLGQGWAECARPASLGPPAVCQQRLSGFTEPAGACTVWMKASVPAPCRDPASAPTVSFGTLFSFWAVSGGVLALRVPAPDPIGQPLACGAGRAFGAHPRIGAPCCGVRLRARGALSFVCGAVPLSPRPSPAAPAPSRCGRPAGALSRRRLTPRTLAAPLWDSRDSRAASGGRSLRRETRPSRLEHAPLPRS